MANVGTSARGPNTTYIPLARVGSVGVHIGSVRVCIGSARLFGNQHVGIFNMKTSRWGSNPTAQREGFRVAVEYRLNIFHVGKDEKRCFPKIARDQGSGGWWWWGGGGVFRHIGFGLI